MGFISAFKGLKWSDSGNNKIYKTGTSPVLFRESEIQGVIRSYERILLENAKQRFGEHI